MLCLYTINIFFLLFIFTYFFLSFFSFQNFFNLTFFTVFAPFLLSLSLSTIFVFSGLLLTCLCFHSFHFSILTHTSTFCPITSSPYLSLQQYPLFSSCCHLSLPSLLSFSVSHSSPLYSVSLLSVLPTSSALRSCSTGDSLLSSAFIRSAKSAPALAPPLPVLLHHHHPLLPPLADQLAGTHSLHYLSACLPVCLETLLVCTSVGN